MAGGAGIEHRRTRNRYSGGFCCPMSPIRRPGGQGRNDVFELSKSDCWYIHEPSDGLCMTCKAGSSGVGSGRELSDARKLASPPAGRSINCVICAEV